MFYRLSPVKLWRNISIFFLMIGVAFALIGTFTISGDMVVQWSSKGVPTNYSGKWVLWVMAALAFLSMFTHKRLGGNSIGSVPLSKEISGAISSGLTATWSIINAILVIYNYLGSTIVLIVGACLVVFSYVSFALLACIRKRQQKNNLYGNMKRYKRE